MVVITGSPGVGKTVLGIRLAERLCDGIVLEPQASHLTKRDSLTIMTMFGDWLVLGVQVAQSGRFLVIPSFARPDELDLLPCARGSVRSTGSRWSVNLTFSRIGFEAAAGHALSTKPRSTP